MVIVSLHFFFCIKIITLQRLHHKYYTKRIVLDTFMETLIFEKRRQAKIYIYFRLFQISLMCNYILFHLNISFITSIFEYFPTNQIV